MSKPSEKAMQLAGRLQVHCAVIYHHKDGIKQQRRELAELIDAHTAEALAEHQRVIEMARVALINEDYLGNPNISYVNQALTEIAKLRKE